MTTEKPESPEKSKLHEEQAGEKKSLAPLRFFRSSWRRIWRGNPPGAILLGLGMSVAVIMAIPIVYVIWRSIFAGTDRWRRLLDQRIPELLWNTLSLTAVVTLCSVIIGVALAWIVIRTDVPGRKIWQWVLALPLVIPPYVGAMTYVIVFGPSGWARNYWRDSWLVDLLGEYPINMYSFWGVCFVLTMFTYPYVFLIACASLRKMNQNFEDAARSQGMTTAQIFWKVNLPSLRPAIGAGAILISLYVLSDFGAIAMLRYVTFTAAIYFQTSGFDTASASVLSLVLIVLTALILWIESLTRRRNKYYQTSNNFKEPEILPLGKWKPLAIMGVGLVFVVSVLLPIIVLLYWSYIGIERGALDTRFFEFAWNSLRVSGFAAIICMLVALPIIYLKSRYPSIVSSAIDKMSYAGYVLPGVIVALGFIFVFNNYIPILYSTFYMVAIAMVVRFLPQALQSGEASLSLVSPKMDEAARSLGHPSWKVMFKVILPAILPGVLAGGALVFVSSIKELPATLMLRPPGFDTLAVRIYYEAAESIYYLAAPAALLIIIVSILPLRYLLKKY